jgi:ABC-type multidrug transport system fused ATPase/permease subunit
MGVFLMPFAIYYIVVMSDYFESWQASRIKRKHWQEVARDYRERNFQRAAAKYIIHKKKHN